MFNNKGSTSIDVIVATLLLTLAVMTITASFNTGNYVIKSNREIQEYSSKVVTRITDLEDKSISDLRDMDNTEEVIDDITYKYRCSISEYNTLHMEVQAIFKKLDNTFIIEKGL